MPKNTKFGALYIVATPIGNLEDISKRGLMILDKVNLCAAENTRNSKKLLKKYNLNTPLVAYHKYSEESKLNFLISTLKSGKDVGLISDAGTPLISDPGYLLVNKALEEGIRVIPIPGPSSLIAALSVSGMPLDKFIFYGFPPKKKKALETFLEILAVSDKTSIIFETKLRIIGFLETLAEISPNREIFVAREMTKLHESFYRGTVVNVIEELSSQKNALRGEFVLVIGSNKKTKSEDFLNKEQEKVIQVLLKNMKKNEALNLASKSFGIKKNSLYKLLLKEN
tara:strand:+ start:155 stop:1003 length:849 start_codon:yes stop_codon:yes gene_type:complete